MRERIPHFLAKRQAPAAAPTRSPRIRTSFVNQGVEHVASVLRTGFIQWETASRRGFLQGLDARVKVLFLILFIVLVSLKKTILSEGAIGLFLFGLAVASRINLPGHYRKILTLTFVFGFLLALPSAFNIITPGEVVLPVVHFERSRSFGILTFPQEVGLTDEGLTRVAMLSLRVMNSLSVSLLVFATTPFMEFMKALRILRVPDVFLMTIMLSYKYIFIFATTVYNMHLAKKSRLAGTERYAEARRWIAGRIVFIYHKSRQRCEEVFKAMVSRGLSDAVKLRGLPPLSIRDWLAGAGLLIAAIFFYRS
ncbi:MAG TPA: energy-coupling factor transporter transmembrane component T [Thermodesulfovibrionales bacterium]|nr:energy-coupling factor transporter transmembrane component T [Thermodesulfovibrionales bacterium]